MPAAADNPDGFWEHLRFVKLNDEILNAVGAAWDLPPAGSETFAGENLAPLRAKARLLVEGFAGGSVWGWKDPRNCLTLPFWENILPGLKSVIIVRNPLEVAYSMHKRNGTSYALGIRLWEIYNRRLLAIRPEACIITSYEVFFADPAGELRKIMGFIGLNDEAKIAEAAGLVAVQRRHTTFTIEQMIDAGLAEPIVELYRTLLDGAAENEGRAPQKSHRVWSDGDPLRGTVSQLRTSIPDNEDIRQELATRRGDEIRNQEEVVRHQKVTDGLRQELSLNAIRAAGEINRRDGRIEELQKAYAHLDQMLQSEQTQRNQLHSELSEVRRESIRATEEINRRDGRIEELQKEHRSALQEGEQVRERFVQTNQLLQVISVRLNEAEARNISLRDRLRKQLLEMKKLLRLLDQVEDAAILLRRSRRWKFGNPFAALLAALRGTPVQGFGHLDKNVRKYRDWREKHPETNSLEEEIQSLRPREIPSPPASPEPGQTDRPGSEPSVVKPILPSRPIEFTKHERVSVSIIIPVFNQSDFTLACLSSLQENSGAIPFEVVVVDDASTDDTQDLLKTIPNLIYLRAETNAGFISSCNRGAEAARGEFLVFLNNDTTVTLGWLTALHETFEFEPRAGLVGSKLVYPDGRLQEAGGIIWRDGSGWNRGKFQDPSKPEYNYLKEVSYCSAASVMIPRALFVSLGGFDRKYAPAYYEDTDLAFKVAQSGRKVLYQPLSVVVHYEGITSGTDTNSGTKRYQEINRESFTSTWASALALLPENGDIDSFYAPSHGAKRILVIDHHLPMPDRDSGSLRMFNILTLLQKLGHQVTFIPDNLADIPPYGDDLRRRGITLLHHPHIKSVREYLQTNGRSYDFVILSRCDFARKHISDVRQYAPQSRVIFDTVDLHFLRESRHASMTNDPAAQRRADEKRLLEYELIGQADETWVVSPAEKELLSEALPGAPVGVISNIVGIPGSAISFSERRDILFIGSFQHPPNTDAVLFFAREIFPLVQLRLPDVRFYVIGDKAPPDVVALSDQNIVITGFQPEVSFYFDSIKLSVAPLRYGAGVKGKINQSLGYGVPVVATGIAAEGMGLRDHEDVRLADNPAEFADAVCQLYQSEEQWNRISAAGLDITRRLYSQEAASEELARLFSPERLVSKRERLSSQAPPPSSDL